MAPTQVQTILDRLDDLEHTVIAKITERVSALELINAEERGAAMERARHDGATTQRTGRLITLLGIAAGLVGVAAAKAVDLLAH